MRRDDFLHHLRRPGRDGEGARVAIEPARPVVGEEAGAAVQLQASFDDALRGVVAEDLDHRDLFRDLSPGDPVAERRVVELPSRFERDRGIGNLVTDRLEAGERPAERAAPLGPADPPFECVLGPGHCGQRAEQTLAIKRQLHVAKAAARSTDHVAHRNAAAVKRDAAHG